MEKKLPWKNIFLGKALNLSVEETFRLLKNVSPISQMIDYLYS